MIEIINLEERDSLLNHILAEVRDAEIQLDRMRFRRNLERIGEIMAYEISKTMTYVSREVVTPLGVKEVRVLAEQPVLVDETILGEELVKVTLAATERFALGEFLLRSTHKLALRQQIFYGHRTVQVFRKSETTSASWR